MDVSASPVSPEPRRDRINIGIFYLLYRKQLKGPFDIQRLPSAEEATKHKGYFRYTCCVLAAVAVAYVIASAIQLPLSLIALSGAVLLLIGALSWRRTSLRETASRISWSIFGFIAGMFIVVRAIEDTGLTTLFGNWLIHLSGDTSFGAVMVGMAGAAVGTNLINNVPMAVGWYLRWAESSTQQRRSSMGSSPRRSLVATLDRT